MRKTATMFAAAGVLLAPAFSMAENMMTTDHGTPVGDNQNSLTAGSNGGVLLQDFHLIQKLARFDRERIPERVVHARGTGAHGEFVSAGDFSKLTRAKMLSASGKKTPMFVRFSTVIHPAGSPETARDPRGFALKFYTEEGNWDIVGNNLPIFFIRDAIKFPDMIHSLKPDPVTNHQDPNRFFDFFSHLPESTHMLTRVYSDLGTPATYRNMDGSSVHAFKFVNAKGEVRYAKFGWKTKQGVKNLTLDQIPEVQGKDAAHATRDLYEALGRGDFPSWDFFVQIIEPKDLGKFSFDPLDATKDWPEAEIPPVKLGTFTLNRIPDNFFQYTEQVAFSPGVLPPGVEPSEDRMLQGRLFSYADTQRYRLGANYLDLPVNRPMVPVFTNNQHGAMNMGVVQTVDPHVNYEPSMVAPLPASDHTRVVGMTLTGPTQQIAIAKQNPYGQAGDFYRALNPGDRDNLVRNLAADLGQVKSAEIRARMIHHFKQADEEYGRRLEAAIGAMARTE